MTPSNGTPGNGSSGSGVPRPRSEWIANRKNKNSDGNFSQMRYARNGVITEEWDMSPTVRSFHPNWFATRLRAGA